MRILLLGLIALGVLVLAFQGPWSDAVSVSGPGRGETSVASPADRVDAAAQAHDVVERDDKTRAPVAFTGGFRVTVQRAGSPVSGIRVAALVWRDPAWTEVASGTSDEHGVLQLALPSGNYLLRARGPGVATDHVAKRYDLCDGEVRPVLVDLPRPCSVRGTVVDAGGAPLAGVKVRVRDHFLRAGEEIGSETDSAGRFAIEDLRDGRRQLAFVHPGHVDAMRGFECAPGDETEIGEVKLSAGLTLSGRVEDTGGRPLAGATVQGASGRPVSRTDATGRFELRHVAPDAHLSVEHRAHVTQAVSLAVPDPMFSSGVQLWSDTARPFTIRMHPRRRIVGRVTGYEGPVQVRADNYALGTCWQSDTTTDAQGQFVLDGLYAGRTEVQAFARGFGFSELVEVQVGEPEHRVELSIHRTRGFRVRVTDEGGAPVAGAVVEFSGYSDDERFRCIFGAEATRTTQRTGATGDADFAGVFDGTFEVVATAEGYLGRKKELENTRDIEAVTVALVRAGRLKVVVEHVPLELRETLMVFARRDLAAGATAEPGPNALLEEEDPSWSLRDAGLGPWLRPGVYSVGLGLEARTAAILSTGAAAGETREVKLVAGETQTLRFRYRPLKTIAGQVQAAAEYTAGLVVFGMRPEAWKGRQEDAHFLGFDLTTTGSRARCDREGRFRFGVAEAGRWMFVAKTPKWEIPIPLGEVVVIETADHYAPVFSLSATKVRGRLAPGFRREDGTWPPILLLPSALASHDPNRKERLHGFSMPSALGEARVEPDAAGAFALGPLTTGAWSFTVRDAGRVLASRDLRIKSTSIDLGEVARPAAGPLVVPFSDTADRVDSGVLRPIGTEGEAGTHLGSATLEGGKLDFGAVPFGRYRVELRTFGGMMSADRSIEVDHR